MNATSIASQGQSPATLLSVDNLKVQFGVPRGGFPWSGKATLRAVDGVSFSVRRGETVGLVGESGCGKSPLARAIIGLAPVASGSVRWLDKETVLTGAQRDTSRLRRDVQMIFQDPLASLDPRMTIEQIVSEPLRTHGQDIARADVQRRVLTMLERVGLNAQHLRRYPHEFSGGQCQRVGIARALIGEPQLVICDEPVSALDVSIQAQVINLLADLQRAHGFSYLFIAHDLAVVAHISHRVAVMYLGRIVEIADKSELFNNPRHPYTQALLASVPVANPRVRRLTPLVDGDVPSPVNPPSGCAFHTRCRYAMERCKTEPPALAEAGPRHQVACLLNEGTGRAA